MAELDDTSDLTRFEMRYDVKLRTPSAHVFMDFGLDGSIDQIAKLVDDLMEVAYARYRALPLWRRLLNRVTKGIPVKPVYQKKAAR
jgi:hypothetical protein